MAVAESVSESVTDPSNRVIVRAKQRPATESVTEYSNRINDRVQQQSQ